MWTTGGGKGAALRNASAALDFFGQNTATSAVTASRVLEWVEELEDEEGNSGATVNRKLSALRVMLSQAVDYGGLADLPRIKRRKEREHRIRWFSDAEEKTMLEAARRLDYPELCDFIAIGIDTGFRCAELLGLTLGDYQKGHADPARRGNEERLCPLGPVQYPREGHPGEAQCGR